MTARHKKGRVFKSTGSWYTVCLDSGETFECKLRGKLKLINSKVTNPIAVGDNVTVQIDKQNSGTAVITAIEPRKNYLERKSVHKTEHSHLLAANVDQAMLMITIHHPKTSLGFIDRFLVSTEAFRIPTFILLNKTDLLNDQDMEVAAALEQTYSPLGYQLLTLSARYGEGIGQLLTLLKNKVTVLAGHSGTGKSTLLNKLKPGLGQKIKKISSAFNKGVHTTTFAEMFEINNTALVIDTPGIKELGLIDISDQELSDYFPEMRDLIGKCQFHNCSHTHEPNCAIQQAVANQNIALSRFESYLSMLENHDTRR